MTDDNQHTSKWIKKIKRWKFCIASFVIFLLLATVCAGMFLNVKYPEVRYNTYVDVKKDGFETVNFFFATGIELDMGKPIVIREAGMELLSRWHHPNGIYYKYSVVYRNGTILESSKEFLPYTVNRTLMDFVDIELSILQIFSHYGESFEGFTEDLFVGIPTGIGALIFLMLAALFYDDALPWYKCGRRRRYR